MNYELLLLQLNCIVIRSINKLIRVGRKEPVVVIRVDKHKGYIDLSKRRVSAEDVERCTEVFSKAKVRLMKYLNILVATVYYITIFVVKGYDWHLDTYLLY